jgi:hypothetical protein
MPSTRNALSALGTTRLRVFIYMHTHTRSVTAEIIPSLGGLILKFNLTGQKDNFCFTRGDFVMRRCQASTNLIRAT